MKFSPSSIVQFGGVVVASSRDISLSRTVTFGCVVSRNFVESYRQMSLPRIVKIRLSRIAKFRCVVSRTSTESCREICLSDIVTCGGVVL